MRRRTLLVTGLAAMSARGATAAEPSGGLYFPPGCRLGIQKPDGMAPLTGDPRNLLHPDHSFQILFWELPVLGEPYDADHWNDRPNRVKLLSQTTVSSTERRLFEMTDFAGDANHSWLTFLVRTTDARGRPDWFGRLHLITRPMGGSSGERVRWRETIDAVVGSVTVRPALSVAEMLVEHGIAMDLSGLYPHQFGAKLVVSLTPPRTLAERWTNDCYISMSDPPKTLPFPWDGNQDSDEGRQVMALTRQAARATTHGPVSEFTSNGIDWFVETEHPLAGTGVHVREAQGLGRREISLTSFCRHADRSAIGAALERVARSVRFEP